MKKSKYMAIEFAKNLLKAFYIFPLHKNRIIFSSYSGKQYSCNPKYISQYLTNNYEDDLDIIWAFNHPEDFQLDPGIRKVRFKSIKYIYYALTSGIFVDNVESWSVLPKRRGQLVINTWHGGGAYKGVGLKRRDSDFVLDRNMLNKHKRVSLYVSSSKAFTEMTLRDSFGYSGDVIECGMPRNDILINSPGEKFIQEIKNKIGVGDEKLVIYAPTFRNDKEYRSSIDYNVLIKSLKERFGREWKVLYRGHYYIEAEKNFDSDRILDVTNYPDMQELLLISDVLVTDYSSSMWDFSLTGRPCFLYADDLDQYIDERAFYTPVSSWPFPLAETNSKLRENIISFDEDVYRAHIENHHDDLENFETGRAAEIIGERIISYIKNKNELE